VTLTWNSAVEFAICSDFITGMISSSNSFPAFMKRNCLFYILFFDFGEAPNDHGGHTNYRNRLPHQNNRK
jgi:hypothetical protein